MRCKFFCAIIFNLIAFHLVAQDHNNQISLRIGEPMAIGYRRFLSEKNSMEILVGTAGKTWSKRYYQRSADHYFDNDLVAYVNHKVNEIYYLQVRYVVHTPIPWPQVPGKFNWYWGGGALFKWADVSYSLRDNETKESFTADVTDYDIGPEAIIGIDYTLEDVPLTFYSESSILIETHDWPGVFRGFLVIGTRIGF